MRERKTHVEQVQLSGRLADAVYEEAARRGVSRSQVAREALEHHLGFRGEGTAEPCRSDTTGRNYGKK